MSEPSAAGILSKVHGGHWRIDQCGDWLAHDPYLIDPALRKAGKRIGSRSGNLKICRSASRTPFSFTRVQVNGWERTSTSHGGYVIRKSDDPERPADPQQPLHASSCTVNWSENDQVYLCPATMPIRHAGRSAGWPSASPAWTVYMNSVSLKTAVLEIFYKEGLKPCGKKSLNGWMNGLA